MRSIQRVLAVRLLVSLLAVLTITSLGLLFSLRLALQSQFDDALGAKARLLSAFVKRDETGTLEMDLEEAPMPEFERPGGEYFVVWDKHVALFSSPSTDGQTPPLGDRSASGTTFQDAALPDGRAGRTVSLTFVPRTEADDAARTPPPVVAPATAMAQPAGQPLQMQVARERLSLDARMREIFLAVGLMALALMLAIPLVIARVIPRSLRPLDDLARRTAAIDAQSLDQRFPTTGLPSELAGITVRLNELLERLATSFERERRFSADVAHELRTPIAELRALAEVALAEPAARLARDTAALADARDVAVQMQSLVTSLLALSRCESGHQPVQLEPVDVAAAVSRALDSFAGATRDRRLQVDARELSRGGALADPALLDAVLGNLMGNAVSYAPDAGRIVLSTALTDSGAAITIANTQPAQHAIGERDLPHLFEPFWRKDPSRTDGLHSGLGLALVAAMVRLMNGTVAADLPHPGWIRFAIQLPKAPKPDQATAS
ncbi:MAG TPA: ATP-binding protein [Polyangia bacterium]|nr:ATP-binding protein [Polyangia bacterium]